MKLEHSQLIANLKYCLILLENRDINLNDEQLSNLLKKTSKIKKAIDKHLKPKTENK
jgi:hypothetical protein